MGFGVVGEVVGFGEAQVGGDGDVRFGAQGVSDPPDAQVGDAGDSVDLLKVVAVPIAKRAAPAVAALAAGAVIGFLLGRRNRKAQVHPPALKADDLLAALTRLVS